MNLITQSEFARQIGCDRSWVSKLKREGRLVLRDGKVDAAASRAKMAATAAGTRADVAQRHEDYRAAPPSQEGESNSGSRAAAQARLDWAKARRAELELKELEGRLIDVGSARHLVSDAFLHLRTEIENTADLLAPELSAETNADRVHAILSEHVELLLHRAADRIQSLGGKLGGGK